MNCSSCDQVVNPVIERLTGPMIRNLDDDRKAKLSALMGTDSPTLCAGCFNATAGVINAQGGPRA